MSIEAMKQALEALDGTEALLQSMGLTHLFVYGEVDKAITALRQAIEQEEQAQPVDLKPCWYESKEMKMCRKCGQVHAEAIIDTAPPPRQPLTDEEIRKVNQEVWGYVSKDHTKMWQYARAIEAAHGIKENT